MTTRHNHHLSDSELAWLWSRYQRCTFPVGSFPKRFARNTLDRLSEDGRLMACDLAFQYRRQIFGKTAAKWTFGQFAIEVSARAARTEASMARSFSGRDEGLRLNLTQQANDIERTTDRSVERIPKGGR